MIVVQDQCTGVSSQEERACVQTLVGIGGSRLGHLSSALLNNSREVAGLLGITVIGAVLRSRQGAALSQGVRPAEAFLDGYHAGLALTIVLVLAGVVISYLALRRLPARSVEPAAADGVAADEVAADEVAADEVAADEVAADEVAAGPELAGRPS
jgi:hypothetical protein